MQPGRPEAPVEASEEVVGGLFTLWPPESCSPAANFVPAGNLALLSEQPSQGFLESN